jgi:hypothetical protein
MPYSGSGSFTRVHDWTTDEGNAVNITASRMDAEDDGFATGLSTVICKDGQTTTTAAIPFAVGLKVSDGLVATPSLAFTSDVDTGFYRIGSGNVGLALNGVARATWAVDSAMTVSINTAATNTVTNVLALTSQSSGTPAAGIGAGIALIAETAAGNDETGAVIHAVATDVTSTSEDFDLVFKTMAAGAAADEKFRMTSDDKLKQTIGSTTYTVATQLVHTAVTTAATQTEIDIKDLPTGTTELLIRITALEPTNSGDEFFMLVSTDNGATFKTGAAEYEWHKDTAVDASAGSDYDISDSEWEIMENVATGSTAYGYIRVFFATNRTWYESSFNYDISSSTHAFVRSQGMSAFTGNAVRLKFSTDTIATITYSVVATVG